MWPGCARRCPGVCRSAMDVRDLDLAYGRAASSRTPRACLAVGHHRDLGRLAWRSPACAGRTYALPCARWELLLTSRPEITPCRSVLSQRATERASPALAKDAPSGRGRRAPHGRSAYHGGSPGPARASPEIFRLAGRRHCSARPTVSCLRAVSGHVVGMKHRHSLGWLVPPGRCRDSAFDVGRSRCARLAFGCGPARHVYG